MDLMTRISCQLFFKFETIIVHIKANAVSKKVLAWCSKKTNLVHKFYCVQLQIVCICTLLERFYLQLFDTFTVLQ